jgi:hypothetical protein
MGRYVAPGAQHDPFPIIVPGQREIEEPRQVFTQEQYNSMPGVLPDNSRGNTTHEPVSAVVERTADL